MGSWYVLAVASGEKDFALEKATKSVEGVAVMLASQSTLKMRASRHRWVRPGARLGEMKYLRWDVCSPHLPFSLVPWTLKLSNTHFISVLLSCSSHGASPMVKQVRNLPAMQETQETLFSIPKIGRAHV